MDGEAAAIWQQIILEQTTSGNFGNNI